MLASKAVAALSGSEVTPITANAIDSTFKTNSIGTQQPDPLGLQQHQLMITQISSIKLWAHECSLSRTNGLLQLATSLLPGYLSADLASSHMQELGTMGGRLEDTTLSHSIMSSSAWALHQVE